MFGGRGDIAAVDATQPCPRRLRRPRSPQPESPDRDSRFFVPEKHPSTSSYAQQVRSCVIRKGC